MELNFTTYFPFYDSRLPHQPIEIRPNGIVFWNGKEIESGEEFKQAMIEISKILIAGFNGINKSFDWQPIETAPKDGTEILLFSPNGIIQGFFNGQRWKQDIFYENSDDYFIFSPSHWMPLPDSPEDQQQFSGEIQHHPV